MNTGLSNTVPAAAALPPEPNLGTFAPLERGALLVNTGSSNTVPADASSSSNRTSAPHERGALPTAARNSGVTEHCVGVGTTRGGAGVAANDAPETGRGRGCPCPGSHHGGLESLDESHTGQSTAKWPLPHDTQV